MKRILVVSWDGAGNVAPMLALASELVRAGHLVRMLGHHSLHLRAERVGCAFVGFTRLPDRDSVVPVDLGDEFTVLGDELLANPDVGREVLTELDRAPADLVIVDAMLLTALCAAQSRVPTISLFHTAMAIFRAGPLFDLLSPHVPALNTFRSDLGLAPVEAFTQIHDDCAVSLVADVREFEPDFPVPANARYLGPFLAGPGLGIQDASPPRLRGGGPGVLVSLSSSYQDQLEVVRRIAAALAQAPVEAVITTGNAIDPAEVAAAPTVHVAAYVPHEALLPDVEVVVTHGGLGTVMAALSHGLPVVCLPMGRDQFFNAAMVDRLGVGRVLAVEASAGQIREAVCAVLEDQQMRAAAREFASVIATYPGTAGAVREIEELAMVETRRRR